MAIRPLFGRGFIAGIDSQEQVKVYKDTLSDKERANLREETDRQMKDIMRREFAGPHWSNKELSKMTERDWRIFKEDFGITTKGASIPNPLRNWEESGMPKQLLEGIAKKGYTKPTAIQMAAIPIGLQFRDIVGVAETGSGKTAAFVCCASYADSQF